MAHLPLSNSSVETPMERIFEKVMLRKMTDEEKDILELNIPVKAIKLVVPRAGPSHKKDSHSAKDNDVN
jgi:hypothetical protein